MVDVTSKILDHFKFWAMKKKKKKAVKMDKNITEFRPVWSKELYVKTCENNSLHIDVTNSEVLVGDYLTNQVV